MCIRDSRHIAFFRIFKMAAATILDFWNRKISLFICFQRVETHQHAKLCQNRSIGCEDIKIFFCFSRWHPSPSWIVEFTKSVASLQRYCDFSNFQDGHCHHLGFLKSQNLIGYWGPEGRDASAIFQDGGRPPSLIHLRHIWTIHTEYLGVSITLQNLVTIDAVVFIIWTF